MSVKGFRFNDVVHKYDYDSLDNIPTPDKTLTKDGEAADSKTVGDAITTLHHLVGTPLVASSAASMTDRTKIYVYTGSETGYVNGHWYYFDGTSWADGGVYNSTALETDKTLTVENAAADAKKTGDSLDDLKSALFQSEATWPGIKKNGLFVNDNGNHFESSSGFTITYFKVFPGIEYTIKAVKKHDADAITWRIASSIMEPAVDVEASFITSISATDDQTVYTYKPENEVYLSISGWMANVENVSCSITGVYETIRNIERTSEDIAESVADLYAETTGSSTSINYEQIRGLNYLYDGTFISGAGYSTETVSIKKGYYYAVTIKSTNAPAEYRIVQSNSKPAENVVGTYIEKILTGAQGGSNFEYLYTFYAENDGYLSFVHWLSGSRPDDNGNTTLICVEKNNGRIGALEKQVDNISQTSAAFLIRDSYENLKKLYCATEALVSNNGIVTMNQWTELPHISPKIFVRCKKDIIISLALKSHPYSSNQANITTDYYGNGETIEVPSIYELYKINICYGSYGTEGWTPTDVPLRVQELSEMISDGSFGLYYFDTNVLVGNIDIEKNVRALIDGKPIISHISDVHGDAIRYERFMAMSEYYGVVSAVNTGDNVVVSKSDGYNFLKTAIRKYPNVSTIACIGNHDQSISNNVAYTDFYKMYDDAYQYNLSTDKTYYYKDYPNENLRFIVLNIYEERCNGFSCRISKDQIDWFINTLASTLENYGVIVVAHSSEKVIQKDSNYAKFFSKDIVIDWGCIYDSITGDPVSTIVDAFISKTSITGNYTQEVKESTSSSVLVNETVNYSADFTNVPNSAEFIAYLNGHKHKDMVGYFSGTQNKQLSLNITHGVTGQYYRDQDDFPRGNGRGATQDAFNLYAIDRTKKEVIVVRIGSNKTLDLTDRDYMAIPYADI